MKEPSASRGVSFWLAVILGWGLIVIGAIDYGTKHGTADAIRVATWVVSGNIVHDAILVPIALMVGAIVTRLVPEPWRTPLRAGLFASACVVLVAIPLLGGFGRKSANPSLLPLDYGSAVLAALAMVWLLAVSWLMVRLRGSRPRSFP